MSGRSKKYDDEEKRIKEKLKEIEKLINSMLINEKQNSNFETIQNTSNKRNNLFR